MSGVASSGTVCLGSDWALVLECGNEMGCLRRPRTQPARRPGPAGVDQTASRHGGTGLAKTQRKMDEAGWWCAGWCGGRAGWRSGSRCAASQGSSRVRARRDGGTGQGIASPNHCQTPTVVGRTAGADTGGCNMRFIADESCARARGPDRRRGAAARVGARAPGDALRARPPRKPEGSKFPGWLPLQSGRADRADSRALVLLLPKTRSKNSLFFFDLIPIQSPSLSTLRHVRRVWIPAADE